MLPTQSLPVRVEFIETAEKVEELPPTLYDPVTDGVIEVHDTTFVRSAMKEREAQDRTQAPARGEAGKGKLMRVCMGERDRRHDEPLYDAMGSGCG